MESDEESKNKINKHVKDILTNPSEILDNSAILQADATVIVGVLFFLTLTSFIELGSEEVWKVNITSATTIIVVPFSVSAMMILISSVYHLPETFSQILKRNGDINIDERTYGIKVRMSRWARILPLFGFGYLIGVVLLFLIYAIVATYDESIAEECGSNPTRFGVNQTHLWQCSMFTPRIPSDSM